MPQLDVAFVGGSTGTWSIERLETVTGSTGSQAAQQIHHDNPAMTTRRMSQRACRERHW